VTPTTQPTQPAPGVPIAPVSGVPPPTPPAGAATPPAGAPGATPPATPPSRDVPTTPPAQPGGPPPATAAQSIVTPPGTEFRVAGGPYTVPLSINNATRLSTVTLTITYNPAVLRVRTVQDGTFMRQGGVNASFTPRIDAVAGRVDIAISRTADQTGASGAGLLAAMLFDAIAPGSTAITVTGIGSDPSQVPVVLTFAPVTVTVR
jgi:general secretion pathway protein D